MLSCLVDGGYTEIQILGQIVNAWRDPSPHWGWKAFAELLARVAEVPGVRRVRFTTSHPRYFTPAIVEAIDAHPALCEQVHLPVQAGSSEVLARMLRGYSREEYLEKIHYLRRAQRAISISTDIIVGFCGESEKDFEQDALTPQRGRVRPGFSPSVFPRGQILRRGSLPTMCPRMRRAASFAVLQEAQRQIQLRRNQALVGQAFEVLVEGYQARSAPSARRAHHRKPRSQLRG